MFRTVTVHPQELLFRCRMCRPLYVARNALPDTSRWHNVWGSSSSKVVPAGRISTYHSLHIQYLQRSSWGWTVTFRNMYSWHLSINKQSVQLHCVSRWNVYIYCTIWYTDLPMSCFKEVIAFLKISTSSHKGLAAAYHLVDKEFLLIAVNN